MNFELSEDELAIRDLARDFARDICGPGAADRDRNEEFPTEQIKRAAEFGLMGLLVPEESKPSCRCSGSATRPCSRCRSSRRPRSVSTGRRDLAETEMNRMLCHPECGSVPDRHNNTWSGCRAVLPQPTYR